MRALVIGGGSIGRRHLQNLRELNVADRGLVEPIAERRHEVVQASGGQGFASLEEGLAWKPTFVIIATPTASHIEIALAAARGGCHLFIEKPLSHRRADVHHLMAEARAKQLVTLVACNMRFHPGPARVKRLLEDDAIGRVLASRLHTGSYLPCWRPYQDYRLSYSASVDQGGAVLDCIHEIDLALWYFGAGQLTAAAGLSAESIGVAAEGLCELLIQHKSGVLSSIHVNFIERDYHRTCQAIGTQGTVYWDFQRQSVDLYGPDGQLHTSHPGPPGWQLNQMYLDEMSHFLDCVKDRRPTLNPIEAAVPALDIAIEARTAARRQDR
jgi:predicted dehydrogenase